jgi:hypothetical protein
MVGALRGRLQGSQRRATVPLACEGSFASASVWRIVGVCRIPPKAAKSSQTSGLGYRSNEPIAQKPRRPRSAKRCEGLRCRRRSQPYHMILRHINRARTRRASRKSESDSGGGGQKKARFCCAHHSRSESACVSRPCWRSSPVRRCNNELWTRSTTGKAAWLAAFAEAIETAHPAEEGWLTRAQTELARGSLGQLGGPPAFWRTWYIGRDSIRFPAQCANALRLHF